MERYDGWTLKAADGIIVTLQNMINQLETHENGFSPEVTERFSVGFPFDWDSLGNPDLDESNQNQEQEFTEGNETDHANIASCSEKRSHHGVQGARPDVVDRAFVSHNNSLNDTIDTFDGERTRESGLGVSEDSPQGKNSAGMSIPHGGSFESPASGAQRHVDHTSGSIGFAVKISSSISRLLHSKHRNQLADYLKRSGNRAQRQKIGYAADAGLGRKYKGNEADSLTVKPCTVLETALKSSTSDKEGKLSCTYTLSSTGSSVSSVSSDCLPTEMEDSHEKLENMRQPALTSRNCVGKTVDNNNISVLAYSRRGKNPEETEANSSMNVPFESLLDLDAGRSSKALTKKGKGKGDLAIENKLDVENESRSVILEHNYTNSLEGIKQSGNIHAQSPISSGFQSGTHASPLEELGSKSQHNLQFCSTSYASPKGVNKKGVDHSEDDKNLQKTSRNEPYVVSTHCCVEHANHSDNSVGTHSQDGTIIRITQVDGSDVPSKGTLSQTQRKRKLPQ